MSKDLEYEVNNFANLLHKDCMNLMECLKKQSEDNKPILYLGKHYEKVILPYEEYQKMCNRLESIDNAESSEALKCLDKIAKQIELDEDTDYWEIRNAHKTVENALIKAQKEHNSLNLLMQELDCKDFADLRKYARCGYEKLNKQYLKWEDLKFEHTPKYIDVKMNDNKYRLVVGYNVCGDNLVILRNNKKQYYFLECDKQFFNDLHLERVEE